MLTTQVGLTLNLIGLRPLLRAYNQNYIRIFCKILLQESQKQKLLYFLFQLDMIKQHHNQPFIRMHQHRNINKSKKNVASAV